MFTSLEPQASVWWSSDTLDGSQRTSPDRKETKLLICRLWNWKGSSKRSQSGRNHLFPSSSSADSSLSSVARHWATTGRGRSTTTAAWWRVFSWLGGQLEPRRQPLRTANGGNLGTLKHSDLPDWVSLRHSHYSVTTEHTFSVTYTICVHHIQTSITEKAPHQHVIKVAILC